ncbi:MAG: LicD family protein [Anaerovoracaceae bacterium]|jgi:phosphorylcholine metabolism protein LicD
MSPNQAKLFELFKEVIDICHRHDIIYYLAGGTLIGAVRHRGFIPWDDDMDIMMPKKDWEKFVEICRRELPENRVLACQELDREYKNMFGRYTDISTSAIHYNQLLDDGANGYVIDILPLDPIPNPHDAYKKYCEDLTLYSDLVNEMMNYSYAFGTNRDRLEHYLERVKKEGKEKVLSELESRFLCYDEEDCDYCVMRWGSYPLLFRKDMYGSSRWGEFEGLKVRIPDRTYDYLVQHYGDDWMNIPPHEGRASHNAIFSLNRDYKAIQNDYLPYIDVPKTRAAIHARNIAFFRSAELRHRTQDMRAEIAAVYVRMEVRQRAEEAGGTRSLTQMLKDCRYDELEVIFSEFYQRQWSPQLSGRQEYVKAYRYLRPVCCDIGEDLLYIALMHLINTNRVAKAERFLDIYEYRHGPAQGQLAEIRPVIEELRSFPSADDIGRKEEAFRKAEEVYNKMPGNFSVKVFYIGRLVERGEYDRARRLAAEALKIFPQAGEFDKYIADCLYAQADDTAAKWGACEAWDYALSRTTNGLMMLDIRDKLADDKDVLLADVKASGNRERAELLTRLDPEDEDFARLAAELNPETDGAAPQSTHAGAAGSAAQAADAMPRIDIESAEAGDALPQIDVDIESAEAGDVLPQIDVDIESAEAGDALPQIDVDIESAEAGDALSQAGDALPQADDTMPQAGGEAAPQTAVRTGSSSAKFRACQQRTLQLLKEVDEICTKNGIPHYLGPGTCRLALVFGGHSEDSLNLDMLIPAGAMEEFITAVKKENRSDRELEYLGCNDTYISYQIDYVDSSTTFFKFGFGYDRTKYGLKVVVRPLCRKPAGLRSTLYGSLLTGWENNGSKMIKPGKPKTVISAGIVKFGSLFGRQKLAAKLFRQFNRAYSGPATEYFIRRTRKKRTFFSAAAFNSVRMLRFEDREFPVPGDTETFMTDCFGPEWHEKALSQERNYGMTLISDSVPYRALLDECEKSGTSVRKYYRSLLATRREARQLTHKSRIRKKMLDTAYRSGDRSRLYDELEKNRDVIMRLYAERDFEGLRPYFEDYEKRTLYYLKKGLGLCVSREYFEILCDLFRYEGREELIEKLTALIPPEHYQPIGASHEEQ